MTNEIELAVSVGKEKLYVLEGDFDYETQIENILESFDFKHVKKAMKALNLDLSAYKCSHPTV